MNTRFYMGVDPGQTGGIAFVPADGREPMVFPIPETEHDTAIEEEAPCVGEPVEPARGNRTFLDLLRPSKSAEQCLRDYGVQLEITESKCDIIREIFPSIEEG